MPDALRDAAPTPSVVRREDYRPPSHLVDTVELSFALHPGATRVRSKLHMRCNPAHGTVATSLRLDGEALKLIGLRVDGETLSANRYTLERGALVIHDLPPACTLEVETEIDPAANTELSGLYLSNGSFFTQCEAEGFRRITYFPDRPGRDGAVHGDG